MILQSVSGLSFEFGGLRPIEIEVSDAPLTSDAGLLPVRQFDERWRFTERFADALVDERDIDLAADRACGLAGVLLGDERHRVHERWHERQNDRRLAQGQVGPLLET